jgi:hypothetical protein
MACYWLRRLLAEGERVVYRRDDTACDTASGSDAVFPSVLGDCSNPIGVTKSPAISFEIAFEGLSIHQIPLNCRSSGFRGHCRTPDPGELISPVNEFGKLAVDKLKLLPAPAAAERRLGLVMWRPTRVIWF